MTPGWLDVNGLGFWIGVVSLIFSLWAYRASRRKPRLFCGFQDPTIVANAGGDIALTYRGENLNAAQVASIRLYLWNGGSAAIKPEDELAPLRLTAPKGVEILEVKVTHKSREVIGIGTGFAKSPATEVPIVFKIIEPGDGLAVDVLFSRDSSRPAMFPVFTGTFAEAGSVKFAAAGPTESVWSRALSNVPMVASLALGAAIASQRGDWGARVLFVATLTAIALVSFVALDWVFERLFLRAGGVPATLRNE